MEFLRRHAGETNAALLCLLLLAVGFLYNCRHQPAEAPAASSAPASVSTLRAVEIANAFPALPIVAKTSLFSVDAIEQMGKITSTAGQTSLVVNVRRKSPIVVVGWAVDSKTKAAASGVYVTIDGQRRFAASYGNARPDVATNIGLSGTDNCGFAVAIPEESLATGRHTVFLDIVNSNASAVYREPTAITLLVSS